MFVGMDDSRCLFMHVLFSSMDCAGLACCSRIVC
jgi:hypothetical protein